MANSSQARKRAKQAEHRRVHNASRRSMMRTYLKKVATAVDEGDLEGARQAMKAAETVIDRAAAKGLIHKNAAARRKSGLSARVKALAEAASE